MENDGNKKFRAVVASDKIDKIRLSSLEELHGTEVLED